MTEDYNILRYYLKLRKIGTCIKLDFTNNKVGSYLLVIILFVTLGAVVAGLFKN